MSTSFWLCRGTILVCLDIRNLQVSKRFVSNGFQLPIQTRMNLSSIHSIQCMIQRWRTPVSGTCRRLADDWKNFYLSKFHLLAARYPSWLLQMVWQWSEHLFMMDRFRFFLMAFLENESLQFLFMIEVWPGLDSSEHSQKTYIYRTDICLQFKLPF